MFTSKIYVFEEYYESRYVLITLKHFSWEKYVWGNEISILNLWSHCENETWLQINIKRSRGKCLELVSFRQSFYFWGKTSIQASSLTGGKERCKVNVIIPYYTCCSCIICYIVRCCIIFCIICCCFSCPVISTLCDPMACRAPGLPAPHHLPEFAGVHVHCISDAVQTFHPLMPSSPPLDLSWHQGNENMCLSS